MEDSLFSNNDEVVSPLKRALISLVEKASGQTELRRIYEKNLHFARAGESVWQAAVRGLALDVRYDASALARLPTTGPLVVVANHPFGAVDGVVAAWLVEKARSDFRVLANNVLTRAPELRAFVLPIDFSPTGEARRGNVASRAALRAHLDGGGAVVTFPAGVVSTSPDCLGRETAVDGRWGSFVGQLVHRARATVAPFWFGGQNSRLFQMVSHVSDTLRLALFFHEARAQIGATVPVAVGEPIPYEAIAAIKDRQALADELRARVYSLAASAPAA
jgi:putative hemolysin